MASQQFYRPQRKPHDRDNTFGDDQGWSSTHDPTRSAEVSKGAQQNIDKINDLLGEQESSPVAPLVSGASATDSDKLKDEEEAAPDRSSSSAADDINEKLGKGYTGKGSTKSKGLAKLSGSNSKLKKKIAIAGAAAGGSIIGGILIFLALLPLKIEHLVSNLENKFNATAQDAIGTETENLFSAYITKQVLPNLHKGTCHTTVDPGCVSVAKGSSPIAKLFNGWKDGRLEQKLATEHGIVFGTNSTGSKFTMTTEGHTFNIHSDNIFQLDGATDATRNEIRHSVSDALKSGTLWDKTYVRFKYGKLLERKYGIKRCIIACDSRDKFTDKVADKKLAAKAYVINRVVTPLSESYGLIMQCIMDGSCDTALGNAEPGDDAKLSPFQRKLQAQLASYAAGDADKLAKLVGKATDISKDGLTKYIARQIGEKIAGEVGGKAASDAVPVVGWALLIGQLVQIGGNLGPIVQYAGYAANSAAAVQLYETYNTVASEMKSGHVDPTELGSFNDALSTNLNGSSKGQSDATSTPLYNSLFGGTTMTSASIFSGLFGSASADPATSAGSYKCNDGSNVPAGKLVCPEEQIAKGSGFANDLSNTINGITSAVPGFNWLLKGINAINGAIGAAIGPALSTACDALNIPFTDIGCTGAMNYLGGEASQLMSFITGKLIVSPIDDNMSGGRTFDMMTAGADASYNKACQVSLGCTQMSDVAMTKIQNEQIAEQKQEFDGQSMFARMFDTNSSYSLISRLAMGMPTSMLTATNDSFSNLMTNPFGKIFNGLSSIFSGNKAFATTTPQSDPFGIVQYGYNASDIPTDPETYWDNNCVTGPMATYDETTQKLDVSSWMNNSANVTQDKNTGEALNLKPNPCLLIQSTIQSAGGLFDPSLLPTDSANGGSPTDTTTGTGVSGDAATLAKQVLANTNITLGPGAKPDIEAAANNQKVTPGPIGGGGAGTTSCNARTPTYIDATLLQAMLNIAQKYKYEIQDITSDHACDSGRHPLGRAMDIFQLNGVPLNGHWNDKSVLDFANGVTDIMSKLQPAGKFVNGHPVNMSGIGVCSTGDVPNPPSNINYFVDACDELHVDTGVPS